MVAVTAMPLVSPVTAVSCVVLVSGWLACSRCAPA